ncbi:MAG: ABC transporter ATP-binding protein [Archangiaceae bacterium]|nr:ABC transporter ATP-binding protein [Archangiaceae bacterium]
MSALMSSAPVSAVRQVGNLLQVVWRLAADRRKTQLGYLGLLVIAQSLALCQPLVIGELLNTVQTAGSASWPKVWPMLVLLFALELGFWCFHGPARVIERQLAFRIRVKFREQLTRAVTELPMKWHRAHHSGETIDQVGRAATALNEFCGGSFQLLYMVLGLIGPVVMLVALAPLAAVAALVVTLVAIAIILAFDRILLRHYRDLNKQDNSVAAAVQDYFTNIMTVITLRLEQSVVSEVVRRAERPYPIARSNYRVNEMKWFLVSALIALMAASVLASYTWFTLAAGGLLLAGTFFKLFEYLRRMGSAFYQVAWLWGLTVRQAADLYGTREISRAHELLVKAQAHQPLPTGWRRLELSGINFSYEDEKHRTHHLDGVGLTLERGKSIALVGESGSGKSTLLGVLRGLHPAHAEVKCDGVARSDGLRALAHVTTLFPQEPEIFSDTVRFNVRFGIGGKRNASEESSGEREQSNAEDVRVHKAIERACFAQVLGRLPQGLDTNVAEKGVSLSGGERQRLAIARGLYFAEDSDVLLLDEATSSVDAVNEQNIYANLKEVCRGRCLVATIHKLHLLSFFDEVYFLRDGKVVDHGTVDALRARCPAFLQMWQAAASPRAAHAPAAEVRA